MQIGIDCTPLTSPHAPGLVRVVERTVAALEARGVIEVVRLAPPAGVRPRTWRRSGPAQAVREHDLVGVHSFTSAFAWRGPGRRVQTIHELPWRHGVTENAGLAHKFWASIGPRLADAVVTATNVVAHELGVKPASEGGKLHVIPWGVDERFAPDPEGDTIDEVLLGTYRLPEHPLVLCPGAVRAKKNLGAVLRGLARHKERGGPRLHLVVTGPDTSDLRRDLGEAQKLGLGGWLSTPGLIQDADLPGLLRLATVVPVLSHSEGFGLPALEAHACGTPTLVPTGSAQAEVAGDGAFLCDPSAADSVADGLAAAVLAREDLRYTLPERARTFTWERTADAIEQLWSTLA